MIHDIITSDPIKKRQALSKNKESVIFPIIKRDHMTTFPKCIASHIANEVTRQRGYTHNGKSIKDITCSKMYVYLELRD